MRDARRSHSTRGCKSPAVWVVQFGGSERPADARASGNEYLAIGQKSSRLGLTTDAHAARSGELPRSRIIKLSARIMSTRYQHLAVVEQGGRVGNPRHRHFPGSCECAGARIVKLR